MENNKNSTWNVDWDKVWNNMLLNFKDEWLTEKEYHSEIEKLVNEQVTEREQSRWP